MTNALTTTAVPIVTLKGNQAFTNSRDVAAFFGKEHFNVLRDIRAMQMPSNLMASMFSPMKRPDAYGRMGDTFDMTKDGFTLLAMGFTGAIAARFKELYIAAFNELEAKANAAVMALPDFTNPAAAAWPPATTRTKPWSQQKRYPIWCAKRGLGRTRYSMPITPHSRRSPGGYPIGLPIGS